MKKLKRKGWAIMAQHKENGEYFAYSFVKKQFQQTQITIFRESARKTTGENHEAPFLERELSKIRESASEQSWGEDYNFFITRIGSKRCPVSIDWGGFIEGRDRRPSEDYESRVELRFTPRNHKESA